MIQSTLNSPTAHTPLSCAKRAMHTFDFLDSICRNSENESPITLLVKTTQNSTGGTGAHSAGKLTKTEVNGKEDR